MTVPVRTFAGRAGTERLYVVASVAGPCDATVAARRIFDRLDALLDERATDVVQERIFGSLSVHDDVAAERGERGPCTFVEGRPVWGEGLAGVVACAVPRAADVETIRDATGRAVGRRWGGAAPGIVLQSIHGRAPGRDDGPVAETRRMIRRAREILASQGVDYGDVARTWFYLSDILAWYGRFNEGRNAEYDAMGLMPAPGAGSILLPASTGIGARNPLGARGVMDLLATAGPRAEKLTNDSQKDAFAYGSAFSRGALVPLPDGGLLQLSGTAAVGSRGESLHPGDAAAQMERALDHVEALAGRLGADLGDVRAATVFLERGGDAGGFERLAAARGLARDACVLVLADVCREELLFEIDGELWIGEGRAGLPGPRRRGR